MVSTGHHGEGRPPEQPWVYRIACDPPQAASGFVVAVPGTHTVACHPKGQRHAVGNGKGPTVLVIPSLINRYYVLDLLPERSFLRHLASSGLRTLVIDWGKPGSEERYFDLTLYIVERLEAAFATAAEVAGAPVGIVGYCMGGLLGLALALRHQTQVGCVASLATPWDFHAQNGRGWLLALVADCLAQVHGTAGSVPVEVIQTLFFFLDPFSAERKFRRFAALDPESDEARRFVALEDWINIEQLCRAPAPHYLW